jgi:ubiquitin conjugation factor E4 B
MKRLAKLSGGQQQQQPQQQLEQQAPQSPPPPQNMENSNSNEVLTEQPPNDVANPTPTSSTSSAPPKINIKSVPSQQLLQDGSSMPRPRSRQGHNESIEAWTDRILGSIFRVTLTPSAKTDIHGHTLFYLESVRADLEEQGAPIRLTTDLLDQILLDSTSNYSEGEPLDYLLACWKRVTRLSRSRKEENPERQKVIQEIRRQCMNYCIFAVTMPDLFGREPNAVNPLAKHLLIDSENDRGVCHEFLSEAVSRIGGEDGESVKEMLVGAMETVSRELANMSMNDNYKPHVTALRNCSRYPAIVAALTESSIFLPSDVPAEKLETDTFLGPFFGLSPMRGDVAMNYFSSFSTRERGYITNAQRALRMTLQTHQDELFHITNAIVRANESSRNKILDWFALTVNLNKKRRAMRPDYKTLSSDGFMVNVTVSKCFLAIKDVKSSAEKF